MYNIQLGQRPILPKRALLLKKRGPKTKNFTTPTFNPFSKYFA